MDITSLLSKILNQKNSIKNVLKSIFPEITKYFGNYDKYVQEAIDDTDISDDFIFTDFTGRVLYHYSKAQLNALDSLPVPDKTGWKIPLTFQSWNYTLSELKALDRCVVGAIYNPTDNKLHYKVKFDNQLYYDKTTGYRRARVYGLVPSVSGSQLKINWGDGNEQTITVSQYSNTLHTYSTDGEYEITVENVSNVDWSIGNYYFTVNANESCHYTEIYLPAWITGESYTYGSFRNSFRLKYLSFGTGYSGAIHGYDFYMCADLKAVCLPKGITDIGGTCFYYTGELKYISLPNTVQTFGSDSSLTYTGGTAYSAMALREMVFPEGMEIIPINAISACSKMHTLVIPSTVTTIGTLNNLINLKDFYLYPSTPPTLSAAPINISYANTIIHVPADSLDTYKTATNWTSLASKMVGDL